MSSSWGTVILCFANEYPVIIGEAIQRLTVKVSFQCLPSWSEGPVLCAAFTFAHSKITLLTFWQASIFPPEHGKLKFSNLFCAWLNLSSRPYPSGASTFKTGVTKLFSGLTYNSVWQFFKFTGIGNIISGLLTSVFFYLFKICRCRCTK